jgi:mannose-1-phosphate guanylyltransferase
MKAIILVGGFGTRLRPLTLSLPKPIVEFMNKPILLHQIEALVNVGVDEVILAINYQPEVIREYSQKWEKMLGIKITLVEELNPMGTGGCLANCKKNLPYLGVEDEPIFILNADITCSFPLQEMLDFHNDHKGYVTMLVKEVEDWSKYGVVVSDEEGLVQKFVEKPKTFVGNKINSGIYLFEPKVLDIIPFQVCSVEKDIFPKLVQKEELYSFNLDSFWADLGQPKDYLLGTKMYLDNLEVNNLIYNNAEISNTSSISGCVIGSGCKVEDNVRLQNSVLLENSKVKAGAYIKDSIIGWHSVVGPWSHICNTCVLGQDVTISEGVVLNNTYVLPHKTVTENVLETNKIIM